MGKIISTEVVNTFLSGHDPMEHIITIECDYMEDKVSIVYVNDEGQKRVKLDDFKPFIWCKNSAAIRLFDGDRKKIMQAMKNYGIACKKLKTKEEGQHEVSDRLENGYKYMFYATKRMSYHKFLDFFKAGGVPVHDNKKNSQGESNREFMAVTPVEQYMIQTGKRLFKGYDNYNDLNRFTFDLETEGLNPRVHRISQIGLRNNRGVKKIISITGNTKEELDKNEISAIELFLYILSIVKPDTVVGHNSENFDWDFFIVRCEELGLSFKDLSLKYFKHPIFKKQKEAVLKLGGEVEYYKPTVMWGHIILDSLHAARRAQALD
jgi:DNA polymerase elongation subunit (family B)